MDIDNKKTEMELRVAATEGRYEEQGWRLKKDGSTFWANVTITRVNNEKGELIGFAKVTRDLSDVKEAEEKLKSANESLEKRVQKRTLELQEALSTRDEFMSIASHELKTPLTSLKLQLQLAGRNIKPDSGQVPSNEQLSKTFQGALKQVDLLSSLVDDLLDIARIQSGNFSLEFHELDLANLIQEVVARFSTQLKNAQCTIEAILEKDLLVFWDKHRIQQILVNLISNAIKYAPKGPIRIGSESDGEIARFWVQDSGPGIPKEKQEKIFERFERASASISVGGLGLGLFIVRKIVDAHHGDVHVESEPGKGAKFVVELPKKPMLSSLI